VILRDGVFWMIRTGTVSGRAALFWNKFDENLNFLEGGSLSAANLAFYYASIAVNDAGDVVVGATGSGANQFASSFAFVGRSQGGTGHGHTIFGSPILLKAGVDDYGFGRWGDYSATMLDPLRQDSFWTIQEFVSGDDQYAMQVTQIFVPEPLTSPLFALAVMWSLVRRCKRTRTSLQRQ
jgi:hypothetical protein